MTPYRLTFFLVDTTKIWQWSMNLYKLYKKPPSSDLDRIYKATGNRPLKLHSTYDATKNHFFRAKFLKSLSMISSKIIFRSISNLNGRKFCFCQKEFYAFFSPCWPSLHRWLIGRWLSSAWPRVQKRPTFIALYYIKIYIYSPVQKPL